MFGCESNVYLTCVYFHSSYFVCKYVGDEL